jgi:hypothetical protein
MLNRGKTVPQGLKPSSVFAECGTAEAVPFVESFSAACKARTCPRFSFLGSGRLLLGEAAEETGCFPRRAMVRVGDTQGELLQDGIELCRGCEVDRLAQIV